MPEILSQNEIDKLLAELASEPIDYKQIDLNDNLKKNIKDYDFKSPKRIARDQLKILMSIYENFSRHLASYLSGILRMYCEINIESIEELPYYEYNNALPDTMITGILDIKPIEGSVSLDFSNSITFSLLERLLGGNLENDSSISREFTEIDLSVIERIFKRSCVIMEDAWSSFIEVKVDLQQLETNTRLIQSLSMDEVIVIISMNVAFKSTSGLITCCLPCINLETVLDKLKTSHNIKRYETDSEENAKQRENILTRLNHSPIEVSGILGKTTLSLGEIYNLQAGDVIKLERRIDNEIEILVNGDKWFYGIPGTSHNKKALKINKVIQERDLF